MDANEDTTPSGALCLFTPLAGRSTGSTEDRYLESLQGVDRLARTLEVQVIALSECLIGPGFALDLDGSGTPHFCYLLEGDGQMYTPYDMPVEIGPHTLIIVPPHCPFKFQAASPPPLQPEPVRDALRPARAQAAAFMLCGTFRCLCGDSMELFDTLHAPVVENFSTEDGMERKLRSALTEHVVRAPCSDVMVSTEIKQVIVALIRRSVRSQKSWTQRFAGLSDAEQGSSVPMKLQESDKLR
jgi:AraC family transcriptional regulator, activator of mtrCDE